MREQKYINFYRKFYPFKFPDPISELYDVVFKASAEEGLIKSISKLFLLRNLNSMP